MKIQERLGVLVAPRIVRSTFFFARLRSAGGVYLSGGLKPATETSRILIYPPLIEAGVFPTEIKASGGEAFDDICCMPFFGPVPQSPYRPERIRYAQKNQRYNN